MITNNIFHPCRSLQIKPKYYHFHFTDLKKNGGIEDLENFPKATKLKVLRLESKPWKFNLNSTF